MEAQKKMLAIETLLKGSIPSAVTNPYYSSLLTYALAVDGSSPTVVAKLTQQLMDNATTFLDGMSAWPQALTVSSVTRSLSLRRTIYGHFLHYDLHILEQIKKVVMMHINFNRKLKGKFLAWNSPNQSNFVQTNHWFRMYNMTKNLTVLAALFAVWSCCFDPS